MSPTILILSGGGDAPDQVPAADAVIAADSGLELADELGLMVDLVVGDLDSVDESVLAEARAAGVEVQRHPTAKDATDLELALQSAMARGADHIVVVGGGGGRLDHLLGVALLLSSDRWSDAAIEWHTPRGVAHVVRGPRTIDTEPGDLVSLVPLTDDARASITGTRWRLDDDPLPRGTTRGISNEATSSSVTVEIHRGVAFAVVTKGDGA